MERLTRHASRDALLAWIEGIVIERAYRAAEKQLVEDGLAPAEHPWPVGCCVESSMDLRDVLHQRYPEMGAAFVYGVYTILHRGFTHSWVQLPDGNPARAPHRPGRRALLRTRKGTAMGEELNDDLKPPRGEFDDEGRHVAPYVREEGPDGSVRNIKDGLSAEERTDRSRLAYHAIEGLTGTLTPAGCMWLMYHLTLRIFPGAAMAEHGLTPEEVQTTMHAIDPLEEFVDFQALHQERLTAIYNALREMAAVCPGCGRVHGPEGHHEGEELFQPGPYVNKVSGESLQVYRVEPDRVLVKVQVSEQRSIERIYERAWAEENLVPADSVEVLTPDIDADAASK